MTAAALEQYQNSNRGGSWTKNTLYTPHRSKGTHIGYTVTVKVGQHGQMQRLKVSNEAEEEPVVGALLV